MPVAAPLALTTRRMCRCVAPWAASMPIALQPALRQDGEAADADERDQQHAEHGRGDRDRLGVDLVGVRHRLRGRHVHAAGADRLDALTPGASNSTVTLSGFVTWPGMTSANSSSRLSGFWTMPVTFLVTPSTVQLLPILRWKSARDPAGHGDLARRGGVLAADQAEQRTAERSVRILRPQVESVQGAGDLDALVLDHVDPAPAALEALDLGVDHAPESRRTRRRPARCRAPRRPGQACRSRPSRPRRWRRPRR